MPKPNPPSQQTVAPEPPRGGWDVDWGTDIIGESIDAALALVNGDVFDAPQAILAREESHGTVAPTDETAPGRAPITIQNIFPGRRKAKSKSAAGHAPAPATEGTATEGGGNSAA